MRDNTAGVRLCSRTARVAATTKVGRGRGWHGSANVPARKRCVNLLGVSTKNLLENAGGVLHHCSLGAATCSVASIYADGRAVALLMTTSHSEAQNGFDPVNVPPYLAKGTRLIALPSRETMNAVINKECELRLLPETLAAFKNNAIDDEDARIIAVIQLAAGAAYGLGKEAPDLIRCAQQLYPGLEAFKNAHYIKHNKIDRGHLKQGDAIPSVKLCSIHDEGSITVDLKDVVAALSSSSSPPSPPSTTSAMPSLSLPSLLMPSLSASTSTTATSGRGHDRPLVVAAGSYT